MWISLSYYRASLGVNQCYNIFVSPYMYIILLLAILDFKTSPIRAQSTERTLFECDFESNCTQSLRRGNQSDTSSWIPVRATGRGVRLNIDHTLDFGKNGHYLRLTKRGTATFTTPEIIPKQRTTCLSFWAHITSDSKLEVRNINSPTFASELLNVAEEDRGKTPLWHLYQKEIDIPGNFQVQFIGYKKRGSSDVSLDDLSITSGPCQDSSHSTQPGFTSNENGKSSLGISTSSTIKFAMTSSSNAMPTSVKSIKSMDSFRSSKIASSVESMQYASRYKPTEAPSTGLQSNSELPPVSRDRWHNDKAFSKSPVISCTRTIHSSTTSSLIDKQNSIDSSLKTSTFTIPPGETLVNTALEPSFTLPPTPQYSTSSHGSTIFFDPSNDMASSQVPISKFSKTESSFTKQLSIGVHRTHESSPYFQVSRWSSLHGYLTPTLDILPTLMTDTHGPMGQTNIAVNIYTSHSSAITSSSYFKASYASRDHDESSISFEVTHQTKLLNSRSNTWNFQDLKLSESNFKTEGFSSSLECKVCGLISPTPISATAPATEFKTVSNQQMGGIRDESLSKINESSFISPSLFSKMVAGTDFEVPSTRQTPSSSAILSEMLRYIERRESISVLPSQFSIIPLSTELESHTKSSTLPSAPVTPRSVVVGKHDIRKREHTSNAATNHMGALKASSSSSSPSDAKAPVLDDHENDWMLPVVIVLGVLVLVLFVLVIFLFCRRKTYWTRTRQSRDMDTQNTGPYFLAGRLHMREGDTGNSMPEMNGNSFVSSEIIPASGFFGDHLVRSFGSQQPGQHVAFQRAKDQSIGTRREMMEMDTFGPSLIKEDGRAHQTSVTHFHHPNMVSANPSPQQSSNSCDEKRTESGLWFHVDNPYYSRFRNTGEFKSPTDDGPRQVAFQLGGPSSSSLDKPVSKGSPTGDFGGRKSKQTRWPAPAIPSISSHKASPKFNKSISIDGMQGTPANKARRVPMLRHVSMGSAEPFEDDSVGSGPFNKFETFQDLAHVDQSGEGFVAGGKSSDTSSEECSVTFSGDESNKDGPNSLKYGAQNPDRYTPANSRVTKHISHEPRKISLQENDRSSRKAYIQEEPTAACKNDIANNKPHIQNIPKILLSNADTDYGEADDDREESSYVSELPRRPRRIARANNPFRIEIDQPGKANSVEKTRRLSAPAMSTSSLLKPNRFADLEGLTRSGSSQIVSSSGHSDTSHNDSHKRPELRNLHSWSTDFCEFIKHIDTKESSKEQVDRFRQMIDERYDLLLGRKYSDVDKLHIWDRPRGFPGNLSPRLMKRKYWLTSSEPEKLLEESPTNTIDEGAIDGNSQPQEDIIATPKLIFQPPHNVASYDEVDNQQQNASRIRQPTNDHLHLPSQDLPDTTERAGPYGQERDDSDKGNQAGRSINKPEVNNSLKDDIKFNRGTTALSKKEGFVNESNEKDGGSVSGNGESVVKVYTTQSSNDKSNGNGLSLPLIGSYRPRRSGMSAILAQQSRPSERNGQLTTLKSLDEITPNLLAPPSPVDPVYESIPSPLTSKSNSPALSRKSTTPTEESNIYEKIDDTSKSPSPVTDSNEMPSIGYNMNENYDDSNTLSKFDNLPPSPPPLKSARHPLRKVARGKPVKEKPDTLRSPFALYGLKQPDANKETLTRQNNLANDSKKNLGDNNNPKKDNSDEHVDSINTTNNSFFKSSPGQSGFDSPFQDNNDFFLSQISSMHGGKFKSSASHAPFQDSNFDDDVSMGSGDTSSSSEYSFTEKETENGHGTDDVDADSEEHDNVLPQKRSLNMKLNSSLQVSRV